VIRDAAIAIADAEGLEAVSIRRVAGEIRARPMSIYDHFDSKGDLLSAMGDKVVEETIVDDPLPAEWREALATIARHLYAMLVNHPWLVTAFGVMPRFGPNSVRQAQQLATAVESLGLEEDERWAVVGTMNDYVLGHSMRVAQLGSDADLKDAIPPGDMAETPELASLPDYLRTRATVERFEFGLQMLLDGIERRYA
jgi:AcrR family transcriptional regulator